MLVIFPISAPIIRLESIVSSWIFLCKSFHQPAAVIFAAFMAVAFTNLSSWLWSGKQQEPRISNGSSLNTRPDSELLESDTLKFPLVRRTNMASSSRRVKRKWQSREERKIDREYDVVLVPSDGGCVSGSESDDSDYSIGWLEPHGPEFHSDDDTDNSFAVLVPCYGRVQDNVFGDSKNNLFGPIVNIPDGK